MAMQNAENKNMDALSTHSGDKSAQFARLFADIKGIISEDRSAAYAGINAIQIDHNWRIGHRADVKAILAALRVALMSKGGTSS